METPENIVDDQGTTQPVAKKILTNFCAHGFNNNLNEAALVLGRTWEELAGIINGDEEIDDDLLIKIRGIAREREIKIE